MSRPIVFNLSRLVSRRKCLTPTGIDRVELRHADYVLKQSGDRRILFVHQRKNTIIPVDYDFARSVISNLWNVWIKGGQADFAYGYKEIVHLIRLEVFALLSKPGSPIIHRAVEAFLKNNSNAIYINSGHHGVNHAEIHSLLHEISRVDFIFYLHDLIPIDYPEYDSSPNAVVMHTKRVKTMAELGSIIMVNSEFTKNRFIQFCEQYQLAAPRTEVVHIGVEALFTTSYEEQLPPLPKDLGQFISGVPYFVVISTIEPRKNHLLLLHIWREMLAEDPHACPRLIIVGRRGWKYEAVANMLDDSPSLGEVVMETQDLSDLHIRHLIQGAVACLYPSFAEGWGMPVVESLSLGVPCLCADIPVLRESGQNLGRYISPIDGIGWKKEIFELASQTRISKQLPERVLDFHPPTWKSHVSTLDTIIKSVE